MNNDKFYRELVIKMHEVSVVPPQTVGPLTPVYKIVVRELKFFPFKVIIPLSFLFILAAYLIFGPGLVKLAEALQAGF